MRLRELADARVVQARAGGRGPGTIKSARITRKGGDRATRVHVPRRLSVRRREIEREVMDDYSMLYLDLG